MILSSKIGISGTYHSDPTVGQIQDAIVASVSLMGIDFPIVQKENGDWAEYIDEYVFVDSPADPGIAIIKPTGEFYGINYDIYPTTDGVDWVVSMVDSLLYPRQPVSTVLALDRSGSMIGPPPTGTTPKIEVLKDAVGTFLDVWEAHAVPDDKIGVVDFSGSIDQYADPVTSDTLVPVDTEAANVEAHVASLSPGGSTCIGGAVATALDDLAPSPQRHIILFSDGMQNINPMLADVGTPIQILTVDPGDEGLYDLVQFVFGDSGVPPKPGEDLESFGTHIHTIGVGLTSSPWTDLMSQVAGQTGGLHFETPAPLVDLQSFYVNDLMQSFAGATPQLLRHRHATFTPAKGAFSDTCPVTDSAHRLTVVLSWQGDPDKNQLLCSLEAPGGILLDISGRTRVSARRRVVSVPLPAYHRGRVIEGGGRWRLHVMGTAKKEVPCQIFWIADDHLVHFDVGPIDRVYQVGDLLRISARLARGDAAIPAKQIQMAKVRTAWPSIDFKRFFNTYEVSPARARSVRRWLKTWHRHSLSAQTVKLYALNTDPKAIIRCIKTRSKTVALEPARGRLKAAVPLKKPGMHRFEFQVQAAAGGGQRIVRSRSVHVYVKPRT